MDIRCQQFTSYKITNNMLDMIGYKSNLYGKKVLENSCGEGNILCVVVERYIEDGLASGLSSDEIVHGLQNDIYGAEIIKSTYDICISRLNVVAANYNISNVNWNVFNGDVLVKPFDKYFDYIVGNPPYISYKNLEQDVREFIKEKYLTCKDGKPDYCYAFIENAINYLKVDGKMAYLIPNSIFKNVFASKLRESILPYISKIYDYPNCKLFENALTSSAILVLDKEVKKDEFEYNNVLQEYNLNINKQNLGEKWTFGFKPKAEGDDIVRFGQFYKASITIATQRNNIFVINEETKSKYQIEPGILRNAISPRNQKYYKKEYIIFPYSVRKHKIHRFQEEDFKTKYPNTYTYLSENRNELELRDADDSAQWFEYGRSQAIQNMNRTKLLISTVVTNTINVYNISSKAIPYSGIYIISEEDYDLNIARKILESVEFLGYVQKIGTPASGISLRITADDINQFTFKAGDFING
ncbi:N-6 DNA methylase [Clostridium sp. BNL1100]|uniref:Eco57I restriction-modification methylase domain-containing protein n=1 Tax=Clostridium sp. BNL1100 TaxID=755731 RepID=UPI00024A76C6|nr:N-6 DNA methylase [Clostridium sp. BNL1100]AEY65601.1 type I restriction-modification system methyltransferase subunit [Clostridium sp. BNL1100]